MARFKQRKRPGFSLIELLMVVAIVAVLLSLIVVAVQDARQAASRLECMNNQNNLGIAFRTHHDTLGTFPTEAGPDSFYTQLLPYMELTGAAPNTPVRTFICVGRRESNTGAKRDYGYAASTAAGTQGDSVLDYAEGARLDMLTNASTTLMLAHVWMSPSSYSGGDSTDQGWAAKQNGRSNATMAKADRDASGDPSCLGGPHYSTSPALFADGHASNLSYSNPDFGKMWAIRQDGGSASGTASGRWVKVWMDGEKDGGNNNSASNGPGSDNTQPNKYDNAPYDKVKGNEYGSPTDFDKKTDPYTSPNTTSDSSSTPRLDDKEGPNRAKQSEREQQEKEAADAQRAKDMAKQAKDYADRAKNLADKATNAAKNGPGAAQNSAQQAQNSAQKAQNSANSTQNSANQGNLNDTQNNLNDTYRHYRDTENAYNTTMALLGGTGPGGSPSPPPPQQAAPPPPPPVEAATPTGPSPTAPSAPTSAPSIGPSSPGGIGSSGGENGWWNYIYVPW